MSRPNQKTLLTGLALYEQDDQMFPMSDTNLKGWVNWGNDPSHITSGKLWSYIGDASVYHCDPDDSKNNHIRSLFA